MYTERKIGTIRQLAWNVLVEISVPVAEGVSIGLRRRYRSRKAARAAVEAFCQQHGIDYALWDWQIVERWEIVQQLPIKEA